MQTTRPQRSVQLSVILATVFAVFLLIGGAAEADEVPGPASEYVVSAGDTLWEIASERVGPEVDVREFIHDIKERSNLTSSILQIGQVLYIPEN